MIPGERPRFPTAPAAASPSPVFAEGDKAREAGAEFVGSDDLADRIEAGWTDFELVIATPDQMPKGGYIIGPDIRAGPSRTREPSPRVHSQIRDVCK